MIEQTSFTHADRCPICLRFCYGLESHIAWEHSPILLVKYMPPPPPPPPKPKEESPPSKIRKSLIGRSAEQFNLSAIQQAKQCTWKVFEKDYNTSKRAFLVACPVCWAQFDPPGILRHIDKHRSEQSLEEFVKLIEKLPAVGFRRPPAHDEWQIQHIDINKHRVG